MGSHLILWRGEFIRTAGTPEQIGQMPRKEMAQATIQVEAAGERLSVPGMSPLSEFYYYYY